LESLARLRRGRSACGRRKRG